MRMPSLQVPASPRAAQVAELLLAGVCQYEYEALTGKHVPPISALCRARRSVEVVLLAILLAHLHIKIAETVRELESCEWEAVL
jgi:hypothetical protein